jgi:hypothetical protein
MKVASLLVAAMCLSGTVMAVGFQSHRLSRQVVDASGDPLVGVIVSLQLDGQPFSTSSDRGGHFQVGDLPMGFFRVGFSLVGYETNYQSFQLGAGRREQFTSIVLNRR